MLNSNSEIVNGEISAVVSWEMALQPKEVVLDKVRYRPVWRSHNLIILPIDCHPFRQSVSAVMEGERDRLIACLQRSAVKRVLLSSDLSVAELRFWADISRRARLSAYVRQPVLLRASCGWVGRWKLQYGFGRIMALGLLFALSPLLVGISLFLLAISGRIFERKWCIGIGGKLYCDLRFADLSNTLLSSWLLVRVTGLPRLVNVLLGDVELWRNGTEVSNRNNLDSAEFI